MNKNLTASNVFRSQDSLNVNLEDAPQNCLSNSIVRVKNIDSKLKDNESEVRTLLNKIDEFNDNNIHRETNDYIISLKETLYQKLGEQDKILIEINSITQSSRIFSDHIELESDNSINETSSTEDSTTCAESITSQSGASINATSSTKESTIDSAPYVVQPRKSTTSTTEDAQTDSIIQLARANYFKNLTSAIKETLKHNPSEIPSKISNLPEDEVIKTLIDGAPEVLQPDNMARLFNDIENIEAYKKFAALIEENRISIQKQKDFLGS